MAELVLRLRDREMNRVAILTTRLTIGRDTASDLTIDNAAVSRTHAIVTFDNEGYHVEDADSQNGITVNGRKVKGASLSYGDVIGIGKFELELVESPDFPVRADGASEGEGQPRNIMRTLQMDPAAAAKVRDEAMARLAAQKGLPPPARTRPGAKRPATSARPAPPPSPTSDVLAVLKVVAIVIGGFALLTTLVLLVLSR